MESNNNKTMIVGVVLAIALVIGGFVVLGGGDDEAETTTTPSTTQNASNNSSTDNQSEPEQQANIVELAQSTENLSTLVAAVVEADLVSTLSSDGPFTVFAPTNEAFGDLIATLDTTAEELLAREDLADILTYHVVSGEVMAADLRDGQMVKTVQGGELTVSIGDAGVVLTDANGNTATVIATDVEASNGVVHLIDAVVLP